MNSTNANRPINTINPRSSRFFSTSALTLTLILFLTLTWVLSLREVRLKIGDYYFTRGNFNQAVNWYGKVVRKDELKIDQDKTDRSQYEQDLSKLNSSFIQEMGKTLTKIGQILAFGESKDVKLFLTDPKLFLKDINELRASESNEKLQKAKREIEYLANISNRLSKPHENKPDGRELDYLNSLNYFFKGIIDEIENNFISANSIYEKTATSYPAISSSLNERRVKILVNVADEYLFRSPLNWFKAKELYETSLKSGNVGDIGIYLKLAYIYAKLNNFANSFDFFKKAVELLDLDPRKKIALLKTKGAFFYPNVLGLIPQEFTEKYPFLKELSFFETKTLLNKIGIQVSPTSNGFIGKTGIKSPVDIIIRSAGYLVGSYGEILVNGKHFSQNKRGYNIVILNPDSGEVEKSENFDTYGSKEDVKKMVRFMDDIKSGKIVCVAVANEASLQLSKEDRNIFSQIGAKENLYGKSLWGHGIIGIKGAKYGEAIEAVSEKPSEIYVINRES